MYKYAYAKSVMLSTVRLKSVCGALHLIPSDCLCQIADFSFDKIIFVQILYLKQENT